VRNGYNTEIKFGMQYPQEADTHRKVLQSRIVSPAVPEPRRFPYIKTQDEHLEAYLQMILAWRTLKENRYSPRQIY